MNAILTTEMLSLKQVFVRYVSHEIRSVLPFVISNSFVNGFDSHRSPLNVVHAGLDLLLVDLKKCEVSVSDRFLELVEDIFAASDSAITILNDLLNYEHMDSGVDPVMQLNCYSDKF